MNVMQLDCIHIGVMFFINNIIKDDFKVSEYMIAYFRSFYDTFKLFYHNAISIEDYACKFYSNLIRSFIYVSDENITYMRGIKSSTFNKSLNVPVSVGDTIITDQFLSMTSESHIAINFANISRYPSSYGSVIYIHVPANYPLCKVTDECSQSEGESEFILPPFTALSIIEIIPNFEDEPDCIYTKYICNVISTVAEFDKCGVVDLITHIKGKSNYDDLYNILKPKKFYTSCAPSDSLIGKPVIINDKLCKIKHPVYGDKYLYDYVLSYGYSHYSDDFDIACFIEHLQISIHNYLNVYKTSMPPYNINIACEKIYSDLIIPCQDRYSDNF